jgi:hypothetical protein
MGSDLWRGRSSGWARSRTDYMPRSKPPYIAWRDDGSSEGLTDVGSPQWHDRGPSACWRMRLWSGSIPRPGRAQAYRAVPLHVLPKGACRRLQPVRRLRSRPGRGERRYPVLAQLARLRSQVLWRGSRLLGENGPEVELSIGSFDDPGLLAPQYESWTVRREPWLPALRLPQFTHERTPEAPTHEPTMPAPR